MSRLPGFFVVGAQKAGTTTVHHWLAAHPAVCLPEIKETHFFRDEEKFAQGVSWYLRWFGNPAAGQQLGEVDPEYLFFEEAPRRIRGLIPSPGLIFIFRHPLERAYSHYRMSVRRGIETLPFADALRAESGRLAGGIRESHVHHSYMARGRYVRQLARYRELFVDARTLLLDFDELLDSRRARACYEKICRFLELDVHDPGIDWTRRSNAAGENRSKRVRDLIYRPSRIKSAIGAAIPSERAKLKLAQWLDRLNRRPAPSDDGNWRARVPDEFRRESDVEIVALARSTGMDLAAWLERS